MSDTPAEFDALTCPLCGYDLRGLPEDRCPECGHAFDPAELRRALEGRRDWFLEEPTATILSGIRTAFASMRPFQFWSRVSPAIAIRRSRIVVWLIVWAAIVSIIFTTLVARPVIATYDEGHLPTPGLSGIYGSPTGPFASMPTPPIYRRVWGMTRLDWPDAIGRVRSSNEAAAATLLSASILWPLCGMVATSVFGRTFARSAIATGHRWRCVIYSLPTALLAPALNLIAVYFAGWDPPSLFDPLHSGVLRRLGFPPSVQLATLVAFIISVLHMIAAHVCYLRVRHAIVQGALVALVSWAAIVTTIVMLPD